MPIYEYKCRDCGEVTEEIFTTVQKSETFFCKKCGGISDKIISRVNSNFSAWSDTMKREIAYAQEPQDKADVINE